MRDQLARDSYGGPVDDPDRAPLTSTVYQDRINLILLWAILGALAGGALYLFVIADYREIFPEEKYEQALRQKLGADFNVTAEAGDLAAEVVPPVAGAFFREVREAAPEYLAVLHQQGDVLADHLIDYLQKKAPETYRHAVARCRKVLRQELPDLTDEEVEHIVAGTEQLFNKLTQRYYVEQLRTELQRSRTLWEAIPPAPTGPGQPPLEERLEQAVETWVRAQIVGRAAAELDGAPDGDRP
jgi:hypothetical protein